MSRKGFVMCIGIVPVVLLRILSIEGLSELIGWKEGRKALANITVIVSILSTEDLYLWLICFIL